MRPLHTQFRTLAASDGHGCKTTQSHNHKHDKAAPNLKRRQPLLVPSSSWCLWCFTPCCACPEDTPCNSPTYKSHFLLGGLFLRASAIAGAAEPRQHARAQSAACPDTPTRRRRRRRRAGAARTRRRAAPPPRRRTAVKTVSNRRGSFANRGLQGPGECRGPWERIANLSQNNSRRPRARALARPRAAAGLAANCGLLQDTKASSMHAAAPLQNLRI